MQRLPHKVPAAVTVTAQNVAGQPVAAAVRIDERLHITPAAEAVDYLLQ